MTTTQKVSHDQRYAAAHVLNVTDHGGFIAPGSFTAKLIEAMMLADRHNLYRLTNEFPWEGEAVMIYKNFPDGIETLKRRANA